jgi:hypothetical protein
MFTSKILSRISTIAIILMLALGSVQPASAVGTNDNFANATVISSLPFSITTDNYGATFEPGEPNPSCGNGYNLSTIWYAYTPSTNMSLTARSSYWNIPPVLAIYTGSFGSLTQIACGIYYPQFTFQALADVTYYFQLSGLYDSDQGTIPFGLEATPLPQVWINYNPYDPTVYDNVFFFAEVYDPAGIYGNSYAWTLSDGTISDQSSFYHQFAADGDYTVNLTTTTYDGRSNTASTTLQVRTRDIAITKFSVPQTSKSNTTKTISVDVSNKRYSDYVTVTLYKGLPGGGEQQIGVLTIYVPARATRPTSFMFSYTFTPGDATVGKVTFRTAAAIASGRDALPADNTAIGTTLVSGAKGPISYP